MAVWSAVRAMILSSRARVFFGRRSSLADRLQADVLLVQVLRLVCQKAFQQGHERLDLGLGAVPVFRGEGIEREVFHSEIDAGVRDLADGLGAGAVAFPAGQSAFLGPAAVAIHDDGDVAGDVWEVGHRSYGSYKS